MSSGSDYAHLWRLFDDYLPPSTEPQEVSISKDGEKRLLLALSQLSREIQLLTANATSNLRQEDNHCLSDIISRLISLLTVQSQFVPHLAGNILVAISEFVASSGSGWDFFIRLLCVYAEMVVTNMSNVHFEPSPLHSELLGFLVVFKDRLKNVNWLTVAGIIQVLRNILKYFKQERGDELVNVYLDSVHSCLLNVPWSSMDVVFDDHYGNKKYNIEYGSEKEPRVLFLGNFIQFLCSFAEQVCSVETLGGSLDKHVILPKIINLIPKLLYWCLGNGGNCVNKRISQYLKHKLLGLMIRLSCQICLDSLVLLSWLTLLHDYFQEHLYEPVMQIGDKDDCLGDSPFLSSVSHGEEYSNSMSCCHLQRQAIFLFLRCSISLINLKGDTEMHCSCSTASSCLVSEAMPDLCCCTRKKGLLQIYTWLCGHLPIDMFIDHEMYTVKCIKFASFLLQLYVNEDDMLFGLLLQLLSFPSYEEKQIHKEQWEFKVVKEDAHFHVSNVFNPINLFHLFLAELHYDHQVLLDYLISKDNGISCAEYLLRCLRMVSDSWQLFVEFSVGRQVKNHSFSKRRKLLSHGSSFQTKLPSRSVKNSCLSVEQKLEGNSSYHCELNTTGEQAYWKARDCLLSLKTSMENLHQKNLFPYNPEVLLKRLRRFQELCFKQ
ncbi:hypothetical protein SLA2020_469940 [Shorea laevis]